MGFVSLQYLGRCMGPIVLLLKDKLLTFLFRATIAQPVFVGLMSWMSWH